MALSWVGSRVLAPGKSSCRCCSFQCISFICRAWFPDGFGGIQKAVVHQASSRPPDSDHDHFLMQVWLWEVLWNFFLVQSLSWSSPVVTYNPLLIAHHNLIEKLLFHRIREDDTSKRHFLIFIFGQLMRHPLNELFTFPISFKSWMTIEWLTSSATSVVVIRGSTSMMVLNWSLLTPLARPLHSSSSRLSSPLQNFLNHHCIVCSLAVPGKMYCFVENRLCCFTTHDEFE